MTPNHLGTLNVDGESLPGKADLIVGYIFKHINYESVGVSWGASWLSLTFRSLVINDLSLNPAVTAKRLKVTLTLPAAKWLFQVSTFFKGGVGFGYGVLDAEVEDLKVKVKTGGVEVRTYPLVTVTSSTDREYEVEPVMYPTNLHPFILKLPPFPTEPTFFKIGAMDARDIEITLENRKRTLHRNLYQIPEYLTNVTKVNRHGTDEWEGIDAADFPILVKKDIGAVFENLVGSLNDWEDVKIVMRRGAEWARSVVKDGGDGVIAAYGVGRRGRKRWKERWEVFRKGAEDARVVSVRWWRTAAAPWIEKRGKEADKWWKGEVVPWVAREKRKADEWWKGEAMPWMARERKKLQARIKGLRRQANKSVHAQELVLDE